MVISPLLLPAERLEREPATALSRLMGAVRQEGTRCAVVAHAFADAWNITEPRLSALLQIAAEADASGLTNPYHNPAHTRDVAIGWANLAALNNHLANAGRSADTLTADQLFAGLCAAFGHDILHDGLGNMVPQQLIGSNERTGGARIPFLLERIAADRVAAILDQHGIDPRIIAWVRAAIMATDTVDGYAALELALRDRHLANDTEPSLAPLTEPGCLLLATMLRDADLLPSAALSAAEHDQQSTLLGRETNHDLKTARSSAAFFSSITETNFASPATKMLRAQFEALQAVNRVRQQSGAAQSLSDAAVLLAGAEEIGTREPAPMAGRRRGANKHSRRSGRWFAAALALAFLVPAGSVWLYLAARKPTAVGLPTASSPTPAINPSGDRPPSGHTPADLERMVARLNDTLKAHPDDVDSWVLLGRTLASVERWPEAKDAFAEAIRRLPAEPALHAQMGEVLTLEALGSVTPAALAEFNKAPDDPRSRFYAAVAQAQNGDTARAIAKLEKLAADAPPDAVWRQTVVDEIDALRDRQEAAPQSTDAKRPTKTPP